MCYVQWRLPMARINLYMRINISIIFSYSMIFGPANYIYIQAIPWKENQISLGTRLDPLIHLFLFDFSLSCYFLTSIDCFVIVVILDWNKEEEPKGTNYTFVSVVTQALKPLSFSKPFTGKAFQLRVSYRVWCLSFSCQERGGSSGSASGQQH